MFNTLNLLASCLISIGVASTTPIRHDENKPYFATTYKQNSSSQPQQQEYELEINISNQVTQAYYQQTGTSLIDSESRRNLTLTSNYLQIIGNQYETVNYINDYQLQTGLTARYFTNNQVYYDENNNLNLDNYAKNSTRLIYILKITPYNYNINTAIDVTLKMGIHQRWEINNDIEYVRDLYLRRAVYTASDRYWDQFIGKQLQEYNTQRIIDDIENINNGFYYTKKTTLQKVFENREPYDVTYTQNIEFTETINILSNDNTYIVFDLMPSINVIRNGTLVPKTENRIPIVLTNEQAQQNPTLQTDEILISGTHIIPTGTYEVIDLPSLMWEILTMPFAFVSQAFNLTLFPSTPYQINISNLFLSILAVFVFIWLISFILRHAV